MPFLLDAPMVDWSPAMNAAQAQFVAGVQQASPFLMAILGLIAVVGVVMTLIRMVTR
jgi:hypothetical protein